MNFLLDTHVILWAALYPQRLTESAHALLSDPSNELAFSAVNIWEIALKRGLGRPDFRVDPEALRRRLVEHGFTDLPVTSSHAMVVAKLPAIHRDPFDRMLIAQAMSEGLTLLTADATILRYPGPIRRV